MLSLSPQGKEKIHRVLSEAVETKRTSGLVFGATSTTNELYFAHAGPRVFGDPSSEPLTPESVFWICSQTKMIVAIATLQLIEAGKLTLDTPASTILPELANPIVLTNTGNEGKKKTFKPAKETITVRTLLNHSSGLSYGPESERPGPAYLPAPYVAPHDVVNPDPVGHFYGLLKGDHPSVPLLFEPGSSYEYGYGMDSLGFMIERITGKSLDAYFKEHIFTPLGITSATFYLTPQVKKKTVAMTYRRPDGTVVPWADQVPVIEQDPEKVRLHFGGIGVYCSMRDYLTLLRHLLQIHAGTAKNPILTTASVHSLFQPMLTPTGEKQVTEMLPDFGKDYEKSTQWSTGLCVNTADVPGKRRKGSGWWYGWAGTYHFLDPETGVALVFGSQLIPRRDPEVVKLWGEIEGIFYSGLQEQEPRARY